MAMRKKRRSHQGNLYVPTQALAESPGHPFYEKLNGVLSEHGFDQFVEELCEAYYAKSGRPGIPPGVYFRMLMIGFFEGLGSERGIAWHVADSLSLRRFLDYELSEQTPDHSSLTRIRQRLPVDVYKDVFTWVQRVLAKSKLLKGKTIGVDATSLEANAALRSIVRRDTEQGYQEFLVDLAKASGIETPTREDLVKIDKKRPKKGSNDDWKHPQDPDAKITKMKDGRTHLAHKAEHAIDLETNALLAVTLTEANQGDTTSLFATLEQAEGNLQAVAEDEDACKNLHDHPLPEVVADKGYHSNDTLMTLKQDERRTYIAEPNRGRRKWEDKPAGTQATVYANRRRIRGNRGKGLQRLRSERVERSFAHAYETGGMRRTHLRGHENILKRLLIHGGAYNLGILMRSIIGVGTPKGLQDLARAILLIFRYTKTHLGNFLRAHSLISNTFSIATNPTRLAIRKSGRIIHRPIQDSFSTGC